VNHFEQKLEANFHLLANKAMNSLYSAGGGWQLRHEERRAGEMSAKLWKVV